MAAVNTAMHHRNTIFLKYIKKYKLFLFIYFLCKLFAILNMLYLYVFVSLLGYLHMRETQRGI